MDSTHIPHDLDIVVANRSANPDSAPGSKQNGVERLAVHAVLVRLLVPQAVSVAKALLPPATEVSDGEFLFVTDSPVEGKTFDDLAGCPLLELKPSTDVLTDSHAVHSVNVQQVLADLQAVAAGSLLARHWPMQARRDRAAIAIAGGLLRDGKCLPYAQKFIATVATAAKDPLPNLREAAAEQAARGLNNKRKVPGWPSVEKCFGPDVTAQVRYWLEPNSPEQDSTAGTHGTSKVLVALPEFESQTASPEAYVVERLIPESSICLGVGDSGLGKSPFAYQMGLCVASGTSFLGHDVRQGTVLYLDLENGQKSISSLTRSLRRHLGLTSAPRAFYPITEPDHAEDLDELINVHRPVLVVIDSLRSFRPEAESKNENAARLMNELKRMAKAYNVAFFLIHHLKKPNEEFPTGGLEDTSTMSWLLQACGARALVNQSDTRIGFDVRGMRATTVEKGSAQQRSDEIGLVVKGFTRLRGEFGPLFLAREFDEEGSPLGYRTLAGLELLFNREQEEFFRKLPNSVTFKQAKQIYGHQDQATSDVLQKFLRIGIMHHVKGGAYIKAPEYAE